MVADLGADDLTVVAAVENDVVGALIGRLEGETGRILAIVVAPEWRDRRIGASLIEYAESQLFGRGARKVTALIADGRAGSLSLAERGFEAIRGLALYEKAESIEPSAMSVLHRWGGELVPPERWDEFSGLRAQREVVDERVLAPLLESDLAERFGVVPRPRCCSWPSRYWQDVICESSRRPVGLAVCGDPSVEARGRRACDDG